MAKSCEMTAAMSVEAIKAEAAALRHQFAVLVEIRDMAQAEIVSINERQSELLRLEGEALKAKLASKVQS